jgi:hypothetical protein
MNSVRDESQQIDRTIASQNALYLYDTGFQVSKMIYKHQINQPEYGDHVGALDLMVMPGLSWLRGSGTPGSGGSVGMAGGHD